jgi:hypothetical protein
MAAAHRLKEDELSLPALAMTFQLLGILEINLKMFN